MKKIIEEKLTEVAKQEKVKIIFAVESGSRAWGFDSPDSDYDVRFVYLRDIKDYLKLAPMRDVIEWQLDDTLDINGWDLRKALQLTYKGNPVFFEWLNSPHFYFADTNIFPELKNICISYFSPKRALYHYWHMCDKNYWDYLQADQVKLKKYFYALRPIWAAKWVEQNNSIPPVSFDELRKDLCPSELNPIIETLLRMKITVGEAETIKPIPELNQYLSENLVELKHKLLSLKDEPQNWHELDSFFQRLLLK